MLLNSKILDKSAELLRNDSLEDATQRSALYRPLIRFLRIIGTNEILAGKTIWEERRIYPHNHLLRLAFPDQDSLSFIDQGTTSSLADCFRNLNIQSDLVKQKANDNKDDFKKDCDIAILALCMKSQAYATKSFPNPRALG
jgi:hypothetical protein